MRFTRLHLENWRNFLRVDVPLRSRVFLVGPNAAGKSNFLDAFRFLRDVADPQGGFQRAVAQVRRNVSHIRSLHARRFPNVVVEVDVDLGNGLPWRYRIEFTQDKRQRAIIRREVVHHGNELVLDRPDSKDRADENLLTQTHLQQVNTNKAFRALQEFFARVSYLHIVPQLVRDPDRSVGRSRDPFGGDFLEQLALTPKKTLGSRLRRINEALQVAVPQLEQLELQRDSRGVPHLRGLYGHWRPHAGWQTEEQFSDGTLRLLGLLWVLLDGNHPLLLEEPELSLHPEVIRHIPAMMARVVRKTGRQVLVSTHSADLLSDPGIPAEEVLLLVPSAEDTHVQPASDDEQVRALLEGGLNMAEAALPRTAPRDARQLSLFGE
ncbi:MAG: AAA family ATPase [Deltaproteobacteria bacterium]|nr:AAA family ATPase [Deltaproteobacteria bacterium]